METSKLKPDYEEEDLDELLGELELLLAHVLFRIRERDARVFSPRRRDERAQGKD